MQVHVPNSAQSVTRARQAVVEALHEWGIAGSGAEQPAVDDLLLVVTELLSNAVKFSAGDVALVLDWRDDTLRVAVSDTEPSPAMRTRPTADSTGGRGLEIVAALASQWGQTPYADGSKEVWAEVAVTYRRGGAGTGSSMR